MEVIWANGLEIAYRRVGEGPPLVLVHSAADDGRAWQPQLAGLSDEFTVVAWDEPGAGGSSDLPPDFALADYAHCLAALIEALALGPAHVVGLSWGGTVAQELYRHHPELVATLILADTYAGWKGSLPKEEVRARVAGTCQMLAAPPGEFDPRFPGLFAGDPPDEFVALLEDIAAGVRRSTLRAQVRVMAEADERDLLPRIEVPTLLIWGELDARSPLTVAREFAPGDSRRTTRGDPQLRSRQQPRATPTIQPRGARVLPRSPPAPDLRTFGHRPQCAATVLLRAEAVAQMRRQDALAERWETSGRFTAPPRRHPTKAGFLAALDMGRPITN